MKIFRSILSQKNLVFRRTTRSQFLVVLTYFLVAEDARTLEFCYPECKCRYSFSSAVLQPNTEMENMYDVRRVTAYIYKRIYVRVSEGSNLDDAILWRHDDSYQYQCI